MNPEVPNCRDALLCLLYLIGFWLCAIERQVFVEVTVVKVVKDIFWRRVCLITIEGVQEELCRFLLES